MGGREGGIQGVVLLLRRRALLPRDRTALALPPLPPSSFWLTLMERQGRHAAVSRVGLGAGLLLPLLLLLLLVGVVACFIGLLLAPAAPVFPLEGVCSTPPETWARVCVVRWYLLNAC